MALFSRRFLQSALHQSKNYLSNDQRQSFCDDLNTFREHYLAKEWELTILHVVSKLGKLQHEPLLLGTRRPDMLFAADGFTFLADVTTVSDKDIHKENPFEALQQEFWRRSRKLGVTHGGFDIKVNAHPDGLPNGPRAKPRLKLPRIADFHKRIFDENFVQFMNQVRANPNEPRRLSVEDDQTSLQITYDPSRRGFGSATYRSFDLTAIIDKNPIHNALRLKADQLKNSGYDGIKGIFLCDGDCRGLHQTRTDWTSCGIDDVVQNFLRQNRTVSFVVVLTVEGEPQRSGEVVKYGVLPRIYVNRDPGFETMRLERFVKQMWDGLPGPVQSPRNALLQLRRTNGMASRYLGTLTSGGTIEMSSRMLLEILAGQLSVEDFEKNYQMKPGGNPFQRMLRQGRLLSEVTIERHPDMDDDRVILRFGRIDPAIAPFSLDDATS
jgi:hypothetical protein